MAGQLFRRHVARRTEYRARPGQGLVLLGVVAPINTSDAEVQHAQVQAHPALVQQEDVVGFDVAMDDVLVVGVDQGEEQLGTELQSGP